MVGQINREYIKKRPTKFFSRMISYLFFEGRPVTTKGQWINPIVFAVHGFGKLFPFGKKVEKPIFILGTGRSGTTVLGIVMSMHRDCAFLNEPKALWHSVFPFEDIIGSYSRDEGFYELDASHADKKSIKKIHHIFGFYLRTVLSKRVVDKYPEMIFRIEFLKQIFPDFKSVFIYRNGWDTCSSSAGWNMKKGRVEDGEIHDWWGVDNRKWYMMVDQLVTKDPQLKDNAFVIRNNMKQVDKSAVEWILSMKKGFEMVEKYPQHILPVRYEELVADPDKTLKSICDFCELTYDEKFLEYAKETLIKVKPKKHIVLHPAIEAPFMEWMNKLGYS